MTGPARKPLAAELCAFLMLLVGIDLSCHWLLGSSFIWRSVVDIVAVLNGGR